MTDYQMLSIYAVSIGFVILLLIIALAAFDRLVWPSEEQEEDFCDQKGHQSCNISHNFDDDEDDPPDIKLWS